MNQNREWIVSNIQCIIHLTSSNRFSNFIHDFAHCDESLNYYWWKSIHLDHAKIRFKNEQCEYQFIEFSEIIQCFECHLQCRIWVDVWNFRDDDCIHFIKWIVISFDHIDWMMCFNRYCIYSDAHVECILLELSSDELLARIWKNQIEWFEININSADS